MIKLVAVVENNRNFWQGVWREAEPIVAHAVVVLLLDVSAHWAACVVVGASLSEAGSLFLMD